MREKTLWPALFSKKEENTDNLPRKAQKQGEFQVPWDRNP